MKYSTNFDRDFKWYLSVRHRFTFAGKGIQVECDKDGIDGKKAFYLWESNGVMKPTKHPNLLKSLLTTKASVNLHIKMYAEDRAKCNYNLLEFRAFCFKLKSPNWFREAVEHQKMKYW